MGARAGASTSSTTRVRLDAAADAGRDELREQRAAPRAIVVHADLPTCAARSRRSRGDGDRPIVTLVPCHRDDGTNVCSGPDRRAVPLRVRPGVLPPARRRGRAARRSGCVSCAAPTSPSTSTCPTTSPTSRLPSEHDRHRRRLRRDATGRPHRAGPRARGRRAPRRRRVRVRGDARQVGERRDRASHLLVLTDGSKGTWDRDADLAALVDDRAGTSSEPRRDVLGADDVHFLDLVDGELGGDPRRARSRVRGDPARAAATSCSGTTRGSATASIPTTATRATS